MEKFADKKLKPLLLLAGFLLFTLALRLLYDSLKNYHYADIVARIRTIPVTVLLIALALTVCNYFVLGWYDQLALRYVEKKLPYHRVAFVSFLSYVFSYNIGLSIFGSSALRYRYYSAWGIEPGIIARIITFCIVTFWIGLGAAGGIALLVSPPIQVAGIPLLAASSRIIGVLLLTAVSVYLVTAIIGKAELKIRTFTLPLPNGKIALSQLFIASLDWILAALILYVLLPQGKPPFPSFVALFLVAQLAGATSHVPGGIGVFESVLVFALGSRIPTDILLGSIIVYRAIFYLVPLAVAVILFVISEMLVASHKLTSFAKNAQLVVAPFVPTVLALAVFIAGIILLFSGATPALSERLDILETYFPQAVVEFSHFTSSLIGLALLVIADSLRRRLDVAYFGTLVLLAFGALFALLKGLEYGEAAVLLILILLLIPTRKLFFRHAAILDPPSVPLWLLGVGTVLGCSIWLGLFAYKHVEYTNELWWIFEFSKDTPRFLRASLGVVLFGLFIALRLLLSVRSKPFGTEFEDSEADIRRILAISSEPYSALALLGDKHFFRGSGHHSFIMYGVSGNTYVAMGDPVGDEAEFEDLIWSFYEAVRHQGARVALYEVGVKFLAVYLELGLTILKFGEEALVDLASFSLAGAASQNFRTALNKMTKNGYSFTVLAQESVPDRLEELQQVSDAWIAGKANREKGFSMGFFDKKYLRNFPVAIVQFENRIVAFANICPSGDKQALSIDLMRYINDLPNGMMDFLFVNIILWAKENGYKTFSLGMAPLSGLEQRKVAPLWNKAVTLVFRSGVETYNFQGLRAFKEKFSPSWTPRFLALSGGLSLPGVAADLVRVMARGRKNTD